MKKFTYLSLLAVILLSSCKTNAFLKQRYTHLDNSQSQVSSKLKPLPLKTPHPLLNRLSRLVEKAEPILLATQQKNPLWVEKKPTALHSSFEKNYASVLPLNPINTNTPISFNNRKSAIQFNENNTSTKLSVKNNRNGIQKAEGILGSLLGIILSIIVFVIVVVLIIFLVLLLI